MSGGAYDYLCHKMDLEDVIWMTPQIDMMAEKAVELGLDDIAAELYDLELTIKAARIRVETILRRLREPMKSIEWYASADRSKEQMYAEIGEWRTTVTTWPVQPSQ